MKTKVNELMAVIKSEIEYSTSKDYMSSYLDCANDLFAYAPKPSCRAIALQLFDSDYIENIFDYCNDDKYQELKPFGLDFKEFCSEFVSIHLSEDDLDYDWSYWADYNAIFDIPTSEYCFKLEINGPFKNGIIDYLNSESDAYISSDGYGYITTPRIKAMANKETVLEEFITELNRQDLLEPLYLEYVNNFLTASRFAEYYNINSDIAYDFIAAMKNELNV